ncbi:hypothetical protein BDV30DRAFT_175315 [Aspergillus minisclerotigenes]|uniref:Uncharacterized protein n=1 Tax=Aspergillus minisclerotigenes TaxID=656917 RepID=A0A5N6IVQ6_9EURO|nr:hypothetical protein BDV30DRAFT_175315 [Aspergillus minisclerotigenes]
MDVCMPIVWSLFPFYLATLAHSTLCLSLALRPLVRSYNCRWVSQSEWTFWIATTPKKQRGPALCRPPLILRSRRNLDGASNNEGWSWQSTRDSWVCPRKRNHFLFIFSIVILGILRFSA